MIVEKKAFGRICWSCGESRGNVIGPEVIRIAAFTQTHHLAPRWDRCADRGGARVDSPVLVGVLLHDRQPLGVVTDAEKGMGCCRHWECRN